MTKLSYSSMKTLQGCEAKFYNYKVKQAPKDADYEEGDFLGLGKAFHGVLERTNHTAWNEILLNEEMITHKAKTSDKELLRVMLEKYVQYHKKSNLKVVKCELGIETSNYVGFIDALAVDTVRKGWWIIDLKTASRHDESLLPQLAKDMQLNIYSHFADDIAFSVPELQGLPFLGCRYRQITKSKAVTPKGLEAGVKVYDIEIPVEVMDIEGSWKLFLEVQARAVELHQGEAPKKNYSNCISYFQPCAYFSQCHGHLFSEGQKKVKIHTIDSNHYIKPEEPIFDDSDYL